MPTGVTVASGSKSWSAALVERRLLPPRAKGPTLTVDAGIYRDPYGLLIGICLLVDLLHLGEDSIGFGEFFWG